MKNPKTKAKTALITTLIVAGVALMVTTGFSYWLVSNQNDYKADNTFANSDFDNSFSEDDDYCTVNVYQAFGQAGEIEEETNEVTLSDSVTDWNTFEAIIETYDIQIGEGYSETLNGSETGSGLTAYSNYYTYAAGTYYSAQTVGKDEEGSTIYACVLTITTDVVHEYHYALLSSNRYNKYSGAYKTTINTVSVGEPKVSDTYFGQLYVKNGDIITSKMFSSVFDTIKEQYYFTGLIYTDSDLTELFYLNETPVETNTNLYVLFYEQEPYSLGLSSLTDAINNNTGTLKVSNSDASTYNLINDISYDSGNNTVYVGYYDRVTTVGVNTEVNLCLTDGSVHTDIDYGDTSNQIANELNTNKKCDYTVKLTGDLIISGTMTVGADIGSGSNQGMQSQIHSEYVCLDLCGHEIDIYNYGELLVYGVIKDSVGNGSVHVYGGGTIQSVIVAYDAKGGGSTTGSFAFDVFPFSAYNLPYLQVPVFLEYDNNGWGSLDAYYVLNPFSSGATMIPGVLNIVGEDNGNGDDDAYLIALQKHSKTTYNNSYVLINLTENSNVSNDTTKNSYTTNLCLERHLNFYFYNVDCELHHFTILFSLNVIITTIDMDLRSDQFDFSISPMFSLYFYNSDFTLFSRINFQKGSSLYMDKDSNLIFDHTQTTREFINSSAIHTETIDVTGEVFFFDVANCTFTTASNSSGAMYYNDRHNYNSVSNCNNFYQNTAFYKYATSSFKIAGSILFTEGNTTDTAYSIAGNVDCASVGTIDSNGTVRQTYNFNTGDSMNYNPFSNLLYSIETNSFECYFKTYDFDGVNGPFYYATLGYNASSCCDYMVLERGRSLPLISNGVAYAYNNIYESSNDLYSPNLVGTFNSDLSLIDADGSFYYFNTDGEKPYIQQGSISNSHRNYIYNHNTKIVKCTYNSSTHLITDYDGSDVHVFFCSGYFPYTSEDGTSYVTLTRLLSKYNSSGTTITDPIAISYSSTYGCWAM